MGMQTDATPAQLENGNGYQGRGACVEVTGGEELDGSYLSWAGAYAEGNAYRIPRGRLLSVSRSTHFRARDTTSAEADPDAHDAPLCQRR